MEDKVIQTATLAGAKLLESGAETYRVEDTIVRICTNYDMQETQCFSTLTGIMVSGIKNGKNIAQIARVKARATNLNRIVEINDLSRKAKELNIDEFRSKLDQIINEPTYSVLINVLFGFMACFGFNLLFLGAITDSFFAGIIGALVKYLTLKANKYELNAFFQITVLAAISVFCTLIFNQLNLLTNYNTTIISVIMLLVPGLAITNAIYDSLGGDLVSGTTRAIEAFIIAIAIAIGSGFTNFMWIYFMGDLQLALKPYDFMPFLAVCGAFLASFSFGIIFNIKKQNLLIAAFGGTLGFVVYQIIFNLNANINIALFLAAMTFSFYSEFAARMFKAPSTIFLVTSLILLVPGAGMYHTMLYIVNHSPELALWTGIDTFAQAISIAFGVIFASTIAKAYFKASRLHKKSKASI